MTPRALISIAFFCFSSATGALAGPVEEAMEADRAFSRLAQEKGVAEAFAAFVAPDEIQFVPGGQQRGPDIIKASMAKDFADGGKLAWAPIEGSASADGSQVVTWGRWSYTAAGAREPGSHGTYLTVWARQKDGSWKWSHDIGNADPRPKP